MVTTKDPGEVLAGTEARASEGAGAPFAAVEEVVEVITKDKEEVTTSTKDSTKTTQTPTPGIGCLPDPTSSNLGQVQLTHRELGCRPSQESGQKHQIL